MKAEQIRRLKGVNEREMVQEVAAQLAEMNEKLERLARVFEYMKEQDDQGKFEVPGEGGEK